jgi:hypothetical protein
MLFPRQRSLAKAVGICPGLKARVGGPSRLAALSLWDAVSLSWTRSGHRKEKMLGINAQLFAYVLKCESLSD